MWMDIGWPTYNTVKGKMTGNGKEIIGYVIGETPNVYIIPIGDVRHNPVTGYDEEIFHVRAFRVYEDTVEKITLYPPYVVSRPDDIPVEPPFITVNKSLERNTKAYQDFINKIGDIQFAAIAKARSDGREIIGYKVGELPFTYIIPFNEVIMPYNSQKQELILHVNVIQTLK